MTLEQATAHHHAGTITAAELDALTLNLAGLSSRTAATALGIARTTYRERLQNAIRKIAATQEDACLPSR